MARTLRYLPHPGATVEITQRTIQGRYFFKPSSRLNALVVGCLARAQKTTDASVHAVAVLSSHFHVLATFDTVEQMSKFACHLKTNLSKEVGRLHDWQGPLFAGRYSSVPLSEEPAIQVERLRYQLSQGAKEGLVLSPRDWPGVHSAQALSQGEPLRGVWVDRTKLFAARQKSKDVSEADFSTDEELHLTPLPIFSKLSGDEQRLRVESIIEQIEAETVAKHQKEGTVPVGIDAILGHSPAYRPVRVAKSPRPYFHAITKAARRVMLDGFREFTRAYRAAAERLAMGDRMASFPGNCFPPGLPFVAPMAT